MAGHQPWPPKGTMEYVEGFTCGWCRQRVLDLGHISKCRLDEGKQARADLIAFERARHQEVYEDLRSWITTTEDKFNLEQSTFVIMLDHAPGNAMEVMLALGMMAEDRWSNVQIELVADERCSATYPGGIRPAKGTRCTLPAGHTGHHHNDSDTPWTLGWKDGV